MRSFRPSSRLCWSLLLIGGALAVSVARAQMPQGRGGAPGGPSAGDGNPYAGRAPGGPGGGPGGGAPGGPGGGGPRPIGGPPPAGPTAAAGAGPNEILSFSAGEGRWAWLQEKGGQIALFTGGPNASASERAHGPNWAEVVQDGDTLWVLQRPEKKPGSLLRIPRSGTAATAEPVLTNLQWPSGLYFSGGQLYWFERSPAVKPALGFVPPAGTQLQLKMRQRSGQVTTLAQWPAGELPVPKFRGSDGCAQILAAEADSFYVRVRRYVGTEFIKLRATQGSGERLAEETGIQQGALYNGTLYWTAPSEEASSSQTPRCVRRIDASGTPVTVAEWVPGNGTLVAVPGAGVLYAADQLYRIPDKLDVARPLRYISERSVATDGKMIVLLPRRGSPSAVSPTSE
jgi:hypothetical protein